MTETVYPTSLVSKAAPEFKGNAVVNGEIKEISLSDFKGKWKVLFFYPLDFTFVCPTEITAFSDKIQLFKDLNCEVIACSVDSAFSHLAWTKQSRNEGGLGDINFPILEDLTKEVSRSYGALMPSGDVAFRATYIIDDNNIVQHVSINNLSVGRNVEEVARLVDGYQFTAKHGEVCPAGWTKGADTMKPDPQGSQEYFNKL
ncbi:MULTISPECIES: peroxiredoxin [Halobacteriovorax]|uniref:Peroxiredoxin n=1 Tax=Halobacteriovorax vibrionivorans TaxID=2152716 RepID=A0ABY0IIY2_9BACT|nr:MULTISPECIES: peroxiredoxin [Halobacteriovorax]AYF45345.1 redoxin [Halobacteriovorax sp. BALOs_7]RZF22430.1 peroxiredoxin [Halobacteriovorax vibrionivorans]TGD47621.1 peroxiredoxin [Halobacteriovorax sp. Y22]